MTQQLAFALRDEALDSLEARRAEYVMEARFWAAQLVALHGYVTVDDIRHLCPPPAGVDPRVMGAILRRPMFQAGEWVNSERRESHGRPVRVFRLAQP